MFFTLFTIMEAGNIVQYMARRITDPDSADPPKWLPDGIKQLNDDPKVRVLYDFLPVREDQGDTGIRGLSVKVTFDTTTRMADIAIGRTTGSKVKPESDTKEDETE